MMREGGKLLSEEQFEKAANVFGEIVGVQPNNGRAWHLLGYCLHMDNQLDKAIEAHTKAASFEQFKPISLYNLACAYSLKNDSEQSLSFLQKAFDAGFYQFDQLEQDADLDTVRNNPRFIKMVKQARDRHDDKRTSVAILIHDGVELLDFAGPGEVFAATTTGQDKVFRVFTVGPTRDPIISQSFLTVTPQYSVENCPQADIIVLPGGNTSVALENPAIVDWIKSA
ncbi:MAG: hypothetical protein GTO41_23105, partial [Burkholderiales bacterium]|nr:hypothetical protein [Burkholderiales bacterium]